MTSHSSTVSIAARPAPVAIDRTRTAVIVVDMQNDFGSKGGMFDRAGIDIAPIAAVMKPTAIVLAAAREAGMPIIYLQMQHRADMADMGAPDSVHRQRHGRLSVGAKKKAPNGSDYRVLIEGEWGTQIVDALTPQLGDLLVPKHRYSGFFETDLNTILQGLNIKFLIFTGCTTSICVESTMRDAMYRDYHSVLLEDCCAEPIGSDNSRSNHDATLLTIEYQFGWISDSNKFIEAVAV